MKLDALFFLFALLFLSACAPPAAHQMAVDKESTSTVTPADEDLPPGQWPETVEAVVQDILRQMPQQDQKRVRETPKEDLIQFHLGWGMGIRNHYGLWRGNQKLILSACGKPCHPDDASMIIIEAVWEALQKK